MDGALAMALTAVSRALRASRPGRSIASFGLVSFASERRSISARLPRERPTLGVMMPRLAPVTSFTAKNRLRLLSAKDAHGDVLRDAEVDLP
jgi:hypothetical protein